VQQERRNVAVDAPIGLIKRRLRTNLELPIQTRGAKVWLPAWCFPGKQLGMLGNAVSSSTGMGTLAIVPPSDRCSHEVTPGEGIPSV
jgi:hypothetical protein